MHIYREFLILHQRATFCYNIAYVCICIKYIPPQNILQENSDVSDLITDDSKYAYKIY